MSKPTKAAKSYQTASTHTLRVTLSRIAVHLAQESHSRWARALRTTALYVQRELAARNGGEAR